MENEWLKAHLKKNFLPPEMNGFRYPEHPIAQAFSSSLKSLTDGKEPG